MARAWALAVVAALMGRVAAYPERIDDLVARRENPSSFAGVVSLMATEDEQQPSQMPHGHRVGIMGVEQQQQQQAGVITTQQHAEETSGHMYRIAGLMAKHTVVLSTDAVESFSSRGVPAIWMAAGLVFAVVVLFLLCWFCAYCCCMASTERNAVLAARTRKPHKRDRFS
eukprot:CAMPEP_0115862200 /NCGR_PEP_ID=MMETSP0287-20121206/18053_1 /TAXON_ID=412157 /ORGANISM="Chrysochromulina rotalis, Strain UIO044" /LENGTH=169 /DNA_ID=CAMNT_0003316613 /DNA_START=26 /DNA_END=535 /DNA_ORIENTATION=+